MFYKKDRIKLDKQTDNYWIGCDTETYSNGNKTGLAYAGFVNTKTGNVAYVFSEEEYLNFIKECTIKEFKCFNIGYDASHIVDWAMRNNYKVKIIDVIATTNNLISFKFDFGNSNIKTLSDIGRKFPPGSLKNTYESLGGSNFKKGDTPLYTKGKPLYEDRFRKDELDNDYIIDNKDLEYLDNDLGMTAYLCSKGEELGSKLTTGSDSLNAYMNWFGRKCGYSIIYKRKEFFERFNKVFWPSYKEECKQHKKWKDEYGIDNWDLDISPFEYIQNSYSGGLTIVNRVSTGQYKKPVKINDEIYPNVDVIEDVSSIDINGSYGAVLEKKRLPYGKPKYRKGMPRNIVNGKWIKDDNLKIMHIKIYGFCLDGDYIPFLHEQASLASSYIYLEDGDFLELYLTEVDLEMLMDFYVYDSIEFIDYLEFASSDLLFREFIQNNTKRKANADKIMKASKKGSKEYIEASFARIDSKLKTNSLYGKMGARCDNIEFAYSLENNVLGLRATGNIKYNLNSRNYIGAFATAWGRDTLIRAGNKIGWSNVYYSDTDSLKYKSFKNNKEELIKLGIDIHPNKSGAWDIEQENIQAKFFKTKCYCYKENNKINVKCAGLTQPMKDTITSFNDMYFGKTFNGKLKSIMVEGGKILLPTTHIINSPATWDKKAGRWLI